MVGGAVGIPDLDDVAAQVLGHGPGDRVAGHGEGDAGAQALGPDGGVGQGHQRVEGAAPGVPGQDVEAEGSRQVDHGRRVDRPDGGGHVGHHVVGRGDEQEVDTVCGIDRGPVAPPGAQ